MNEDKKMVQEGCQTAAEEAGAAYGSQAAPSRCRGPRDRLPLPMFVYLLSSEVRRWKPLALPITDGGSSLSGKLMVTHTDIAVVKTEDNSRDDY